MLEVSYFITPELERERDLMQHIIDYGDELLLLTGVNGVGKSRNLQELINLQINDRDIIRIDGATISDLYSARSTISQALTFDDSQVKPEEWLHALHFYLLKQSKSEQSLIIIENGDDFDNETINEFARINRLQNEDRPIFRLLLVGDLSLRQRIESDHSLVNQVRIIELFPFSDEQMGEFIDDLIQQPNSGLPRKLTYDQKNELIEAAKGLPGELLSRIGDTQSASGAKRFVLPVIGLVLVVALVLFFNSSDSEPPLTQSEIKVPLKISPETKNSESAVVAEQSQKSVPAIEVEPIPEVGRESERKIVEQKTVTVDEIKDEPRQKVTSTLVIEKIAPSSFTVAKRDKVSLFGEGFESSSRLVVLREGDIKMETLEPLSISNTEIVFNPSQLKPGRHFVQVVNSEGASTAPLQFMINAAEVAAKKPEATPAVAVKKPTPKLEANQKNGAQIYSSKWYNQQQSDAYVIQLHATTNRENLEMMTTVLSEKSSTFAIFSQVRNGVVIYAITEGLYKTKAQALKAAERFKPAVTPWVRSVDSIIKVMSSRIKPESKPVVPVSNPTTAVINNLAWIWSQNPEMVAIQISASSKREALELLVKKYELIEPLAIFKTTKNEADWFTLIGGLFDERETARAAIKRLPQLLQSQGPWIRSFASIHDEISK